MKTGSTRLSEDAEALLSAEGVDVIVEATGDPVAGIRHASTAIEQGKHLVMVNVEADVVAGPLLARQARRAGVVYSLAYGDQPALICELVDWASGAAASRWFAPAREPSIFPDITPPPRTRYGNTMDSARTR